MSRSGHRSRSNNRYRSKREYLSKRSRSRSKRSRSRSRSKFGSKFGSNKVSEKCYDFIKKDLDELKMFLFMKYGGRGQRGQANFFNISPGPGPMGPFGPMGSTGSIGPFGPMGSMGSMGFPGPVGYLGSQQQGTLPNIGVLLKYCEKDPTHPDCQQIVQQSYQQQQQQQQSYIAELEKKIGNNIELNTSELKNLNNIMKNISGDIARDIQKILNKTTAGSAPVPGSASLPPPATPYDDYVAIVKLVTNEIFHMSNLYNSMKEKFKSDCKDDMTLLFKKYIDDMDKLRISANSIKKNPNDIERIIGNLSRMFKFRINTCIG
jgi:hypothetical protein